MLGIGQVADSIGGGVYSVSITIPDTVAGTDEENRTIHAINMLEKDDKKCDNTDLYVPGVEFGQTSSYPENFEPQPICPGTWVTLMAQTKEGFSDSGVGLPDTYTQDSYVQIGGLEGAKALVCFFSAQFAHDGPCG